MPKTIDILFTRELDEKAIALAEKAGISPVIQPMIKMDFPFTDEELTEKVKTINADGWIFTSKNGVRSIQHLVAAGKIKSNGIPVYAVGDKTAAPLREIGFEPQVPAEQNAEGLAKYIIQNYKRGILLFFCGDKRRSELPGELKGAKIPLHELFVYQTILSPKKVKKKVQGVAFYSPTAVESYFEKNEDREDMVYFTIGKTTDKVLRSYTKNNVVVADKPDTETLISTIKSYFSV